MIHEKPLKFRYLDINFEATVTYSDDIFRSVVQDNSQYAFWRVTLHAPIERTYGGACMTVKSISSFWLYATKAGDRYFAYTEDPSETLPENAVNIYEDVLETIVYHYFNEERIAHYRDKVACFKQALEKKYAPQLEALRQKKLALRKEMRSGKITPKEYQKRYTPIRKEKERIEMEIFSRGFDYENHYFQSCRLKRRYRKVLYNAKQVVRVNPTDTKESRC